MNSLAAGLLRDRHNLLSIEIGGDAGAAQRASLIGSDDVQRLCVILGKYGDGVKSQLSRSLCHTNGDLTSIGDQQFLHISQIVSTRIIVIPVTSSSGLFSGHLP